MNLSVPGVKAEWCGRWMMAGGDGTFTARWRLGTRIILTLAALPQVVPQGRPSHVLISSCTLSYTIMCNVVYCVFCIVAYRLIVTGSQLIANVISLTRNLWHKIAWPGPNVSCIPTHIIVCYPGQIVFFQNCVLLNSCVLLNVYLCAGRFDGIVTFWIHWTGHIMLAENCIRYTWDKANWLGHWTRRIFSARALIPGVYGPGREVSVTHKCPSNQTSDRVAAATTHSNPAKCSPLNCNHFSPNPQPLTLPHPV